MGLDCSHDAWHGAYSAFNTFRNEIARAAGYLIASITYEDGQKTPPTVLLEWHRYTEDNLMGDWTETPSDPLICLFVHSDCGGVIHPAQAIPLANRLEELLPAIAALPDEQRQSDGWSMTKQADGAITTARHPGHIAARGGMVKCTEAFIAGLRAAAKAGEPLDFH